MGDSTIEAGDDFGRIAYEEADGVGVLRMQRPEKKNAIDRRMRSEIKEVLDHVDAEDTITVLLIRGCEGAFSAGADIDDLRARLPDKPAEAITMSQFALPETVDALDTPTVAMIDGIALGGGFELALACDIRIASENARFGFPEIELGGFPSEGGTQRLPRETNRGTALLLILTGEIVSAQRAYDYGIVQELCEADSLEQRVDDVVTAIAEKDLPALLLAKSAVSLSGRTDLESGLRTEELLANFLEFTEERKQRLDEFLDE